MNGTAKAKLVLSLLGGQSESVQKYLGHDVVQALAQVPAAASQDPERIDEVLREALDKAKAPVSFIKSASDEGASAQIQPIPELGSHSERRPQIKTETQKLIEALDKQPVQVAAFVLAFLDEKTVQEIVESTSEERKTKIQQIQVRKTPIAEKTFKNLYEKILAELAVTEG